MFENYFVRIRGRTLGPYSLDKLQQMVRKGQVGRTQEMSTDGESWAAATTFPEVFARPVVVGTLVDEPAMSIAATDQIYLAVGPAIGRPSVSGFSRSPVVLLFWR